MTALCDRLRWASSTRRHRTPHVYYTGGGEHTAEAREIYLGWAGPEPKETGFLLPEVVLLSTQRAGEMDDVVEKRLDLLVCAKLRDRTRLERALLTQDRLREKSKAGDGLEELRRWRDAR